jgi:hypothetical protein
MSQIGGGVTAWPDRTVRKGLEARDDAFMGFTIPNRIFSYRIGVGDGSLWKLGINGRHQSIHRLVNTHRRF